MQQDARAQACPTNMLLLPEDGGYVTLADNPALRLDSAFTIEVWVKLNSTADRSTIIEKSNGGTAVNYSLAVGSFNTVVARVLGPTGVISLTSGFIANIADWHHYALVFRPNDSLVLYVDGEFSAGMKTQARSLNTGPGLLRIGHSALMGGKNLYGAIDEVRLWKVARTQAQINADKDRVVAKNAAFLSAYLSFNDDAVRGQFFENKGLVATSVSGAALVASSAPIEGTATPYKLQAKERIMRLPVLRCGTSYDTVIHIRNLGLDSVDVTEMGLLRGTAFSIAGPEKLILPPDSSFYGEIRIQFDPTSSGIYVDTLVIGSKSACAGQIKIPLIDTFISVAFETVQKQISIGNTLNCDLPLTRKVTLKNTGITPMNITNAYFVIDIGASITTVLPITLGVGESKDVSIRIEKGIEGYAASELIFESDVCQRTASLEVSITRESISYTAPASVVFGDRVLLADQLSIDTVVEFTNTSQRSILVTSASFAGVTLFEVYPQFVTTSVASGETLNIPIRFATSACGTFVGNLRVFGTPCAIAAQIPVRVTVTAPRPVMPEIVDVGFTCSFKDTTLLLRNPYDSAITLTGVSFSTPGVFTTTTTFPLTIQPHNYELLDLHFKPTTEKEYELDLSMTNAKCGAVVMKLRGSLSTTSLAVTPALDFGRGCDLSAISREVIVTNNSPRDVTLTNAFVYVSNRYRFVGLDLPSVLPPGESKSFEIELLPEFGLVSVGYAKFTIAGGCRTAQVDLYASREEPKLTLAERALSYDTLCPGLSRTLDLTVTNTGIDSADINFSFTSSSGGFVVLDPPASLKKGATVLRVKFSPMATGDFIDTLELSTKGCATTYRVALSGSGGSVPTLLYSSEALAFGKVQLGSAEERCLTISNPSCAPITLQASSFAFSDAGYSLKQSTLDQLPRTLVNGETLDLCIVYRPGERTLDVADLQVIPTGAGIGVIRLSGQGVSPKITISDTSLDFGFVPVGGKRILSVTVDNSGDHPATLTFSFAPPGSEFSTELVSIFVPEGETRTIPVQFEPSLAKLYEGLLSIHGADVPITIELRGVGAERGLVIDRTELDFGNVRVGESDIAEIRISANVFPTTLESVAIVNGPASQHYNVTLDTPLPFTFDEPGRVLAARITYTPKTEEQHLSALSLTTSEQVLQLALAGRGVDAHIVTEAVIDFGVVELESATSRDFEISNSGSYPLTVLSSSATTPFETASISTTIAPGESKTFAVSFTPVSRKEVQGELRIISDAVEGERVIRLTGRGGDGTQSVPRISYELPQDGVSAVIGEHVRIPLTIRGNKLYQFKADSFYLELRHDPWMLYLYDADASGSVTHGMSIETGILSDTIFFVRGRGKSFDLVAGMTLIELKGEALFGPRERTEIEIVKAYPSTLSTLSQATTEFRVTNCQDQAAGAIHVGAYAVQHAYPSPTSTAATIEYTLGFMGSAEIEIIDAMGRTMKMVALPERPKGQHTFQLDVTDLPNGHYSGLFRSREFIKRIDLIVQH